MKPETIGQLIYNITTPSQFQTYKEWYFTSEQLEKFDQDLIFSVFVRSVCMTYGLGVCSDLETGDEREQVLHGL